MADEVNPRLLEAFAEQQCQIVGISDELLDGHPRLWLPRRKPDSRTALVPDHDSEMLFQSGNVVLTHHPQLRCAGTAIEVQQDGIGHVDSTYEQALL